MIDFKIGTDYTPLTRVELKRINGGIDPVSTSFFVTFLRMAFEMGKNADLSCTCTCR